MRPPSSYKWNQANDPDNARKRRVKLQFKVQMKDTHIKGKSM